MQFNKIVLFSVLCFLNFVNVYSQVKIGNNPNTINANSILELESTDKGFLPPRIALNSVSSTTPLTSTTPAGMLVYSSGGTLADGYYMWNGAKWLNISTDKTTRSNYVLVKSASDLPTASGGIITLASGVFYEINGTITTSNKINLNGCNISGADPVNDKIVYTGSGEMFTGSGLGGIRFLSLTASAGKIFNINAGGANSNLLVQNCYMLACSEIGTIQNVGGTVFFANVAYFYNTTGITVQNCTNVVMNNTLWDSTNSGTFEKFIGTFNIIQILGGDRLVSSGAIATHISGITSIAAGTIKVVMYVGTGTYVSGTFSNSWEIESKGLNTEKDDEAAGNLYLTGSTTTSFTATNAPAKINGTTTSANLFRVTSPVNNRLTYGGSKSKRFLVICSLTGTPSSNNNVYSFYIAKNGVVMPESKQAVKMTTTSDQQSITISCMALLSNNDYVEVWAENNSTSGTLTVSTLNLTVR